MKNSSDLIYAVWDAQKNLISGKSNPLKEFNFDDFVPSFFCPAAYYYYVVDFPNRKLDLVSPHVNTLYGIEPSNFSIETLIGKIHPDDIAFMVKSEERAVDFLVNRISPEQVVKYKMCYCFRLKTIYGYRLFFHQALAISTNANGELDKVLGIHSDISHLSEINNYKISFVGLQGEPSFFELDVFSDTMFQTPSSVNPFTERELEILSFFAKGYTAKEIATLLLISDETVKTHRKNMLMKAGVEKITELVSFCIRKGYI
ncbi:helix-turn-helix transcriptional regulator [Lunatibacter salilacus]|uniref:helix-turn-helix transcriptional regulator n=1 Tax=Lunatibacter salilacus TaxID=2483804 RepID=UPI00131BDE49|nr:helix-turn-helix transcriptional regulator [Lunatibacter salilacus]